MFLREAIGSFLLDGEANREWSPATTRQYAWHLERLRCWLDDRAVLRLDQITEPLLTRWKADLRAKWRDSTRKLAVTSLRSFLAFCEEHHWLPDGLLAQLQPAVLKPPRVKDAVQRTVLPDEFQALMRQCDIPTGTGLTVDQARIVGLRNAAIVSLLYDSLLRASELCSLRVRDVDLKHGICTVISKGGERETACFGLETAERLRTWLAVRPACPKCDAIFVSIWGHTPGQALTPRGLRIALKRLGERADVPDVSPHAFRRGAACRLVEQGVHPRIVRDLGRWENEEMVEKYTRALEARRQFAQFGPVHSLTEEAKVEVKSEP